MLARLGLLLIVALLLSACGQRVTRPELPDHRADRDKPQAGELYAPHIKDGGPPIPPDISRIPEPVPTNEPLSRYGNRSPYSVLGRSYQVLPSARGYVERGEASWYGNKFHGRPTSSFEPYDMYQFSAAHKSLPLPSYARVTNLDNGRSVVVRVNDRGPFHNNRLIDLSYAAAVKLGMHQRGTAPVEVRALNAGERAPPAPALNAAAAPRPTRVAGAPRSRNYASASPALTRSSFGNGAFLQVGSFALQANAGRLQQRLHDAGFDRVRVTRAQIGGGVVWRVRVGPLAGADETETLRRRLRRAGFEAPQLVRE